MKNLFSLVLICILILSCKEESSKYIVTSDIDNYWNAYDKIISTKDSLQQLKYLEDEFISKSSTGQQALFEVRNYTPEEYIYNINNYPEFWKSIREQTLKANTLGGNIESGITKLKSIYPSLKPAKVYFTIGAFRTPGTTLDSLVLIGSEMALANNSVNTSELPETLNYVKNYCKNNPIDDVEFLNVHEFVHTQQKDGRGENLLVQCVREGIAEFLAEKATGNSTLNPSIAYGKANPEKVKLQFEKEAFNEYYSYWLWSQLENPFEQRDMGYYVGYAMASNYYNASKDKTHAVNELIELDLNNEAIIENFVNKTNYFSQPLAKIKSTYEASRPKINAITPFENGSTNVTPGKHIITITFSQVMDKRFRGFDYGPLGENNVLRIQRYIGFSEDGTSISFEVDLQPKKRYQMTLPSKFANLEGTELKPYLIDITTSN